MEKRCPRSCFVPEWQPAIMCLQRQPRATTPSLGACSSSLAVYDPRDTDFFFFQSLLLLGREEVRWRRGRRHPEKLVQPVDLMCFDQENGACYFALPVCGPGT